MPVLASSLRPFHLFLSCVVVLSLLEFRAVDLIQGRNVSAEVEVAAGVRSGHPYWKAYQNRLLGPVAVGWMARLTGQPSAGVYQEFCFGLLCVANGVAGIIFRGAPGSSVGAWGYAVLYAGLFVAFQDPQWLYLWDYVDLVTMLLFAWAVVMGRWTTRQYVALFVIELANREAAQFVALWLVLTAFLPGTGPDEHRGRWMDWPRLGLGVGLGLAGTVWTHYIRNALCVGETGIVPRQEITEFADGQFFMGRVTLDLLRDPPSLNAAAVGSLLMALGFLLWRTRCSLGRRAWKIAALLAAMVVANLCLSFIYELRVWFALLPFVVCLVYRWRTEPTWANLPVHRAEN